MKIIDKSSKEEKLLIENKFGEVPRIRQFLEADFPDVGTALCSLYIITRDKEKIQVMTGIIARIIKDIIWKDPDNKFVLKVPDNPVSVYLSDLFYKIFSIELIKIIKFVENCEIYTKNNSLFIDKIIMNVGNIYAEEIIMRDKYYAGQVGAQGPDAQARYMKFVQVWNQGKVIDLPKLTEELAKLRLELKDLAIEPEQDVQIASIASAEICAKKGNGPKTLEHLSKVGKWSLDTAIKIGLPATIEALKKALGLL